MDNNHISIKDRDDFARRWTEMQKLFYPKIEDINTKNNLKGIFRQYASCTISSGVRYGEVK